MAEKFYLIDGHSQLYRAFYAIRGLTTGDGRPSNAVYGFVAMLRKLIRERRPDYLAVAFDMPGPTFRHEMFEDYKATRKAPPEEFLTQIPMVRTVLQAMDIPVLGEEGYEADDILGAVARRAVERGIDVVLVTGDKDARQLLGPHVTIFDAGREKEITEQSLKDEQGIRPEQVPDVMGLSGDTSDNVPGVPKVGPKTALNLIRQFGSLEETLAHADEVKAPKLRENLKTHAESARLSKALVTINSDMPIELDFDSCRYSEAVAERVAPVYKDLDFHQFLDELDLPATEQETTYHLVNTPERFDAFLSELQKQRRFAFDTETTNPRPRAAQLVGLSFSWRESEAWYLPVRAPMGEQALDQSKTLEALRPILADAGIAKMGQNIKYDMIVLRNAGLAVEGIAFDTMIAAYVLDADRRSYSLDSLATDLLGVRMTPISDLIGKGKKQITMDQVPLDRITDYACADADITFRLAGILEKRLRDGGLWGLYAEIELPLIRVLAEMEYQGVGFDGEVLAEMSQWLEREIEKLEERIHAEAGEEFNVASPKQLSRILFEKLGLPKSKRTKTGASTNSEVLEGLARSHPLPGLVLEYRQLTKLKSTYVDTLPQMVLPETGCIHTSFHQTGTTTGRLSSSDPNLQNIPIRTEIGERIRQAFVPSDPENILLSADYSQIELRILAHISEDNALRSAFEEDRDIHRFVAAQIHHVEMDEVTSRMRRAAKAVNFGIVYGLTPYGLSRDLGVTVEEAQAFINEYFERYPGVKGFIEATIARAYEAGFVTTLCGRRRPLPGLKEKNRMVRQFAERAAVNAVIQGTAADMIKIAMIRLHDRLSAESPEARMRLQIHDELLFELPPGREETLTQTITEEMTGALELEVPVKVNVATGRNWMEAK